MASTHNIESQIELLTKMITKKPLGSLPSNAKQIPKEYAEVAS